MASQPVCVLAVDDEEVNLRLIVRALASENYRVATAANGEEALARVRQKPPDLMLLDLTMPVLNGLFVCREIRRDYRTRGLPIIMLTARGSLADRLEGFRAGADDYLVKPFDLEELKVRIDGTLARRRWDLWRHPLTGLPGSPGIEEEIRRRLETGLPFAFAYVDIDNFKAYNDAYGYDAGDRIIKTLGALLLEASRSPDPDPPYPGHVGGDDFVWISSVPFMKEELPALLQDFDVRRFGFYSAEDLARGFIRIKNRQGQEQTFPPVTLTAATVSTETRRILHYARLIEIASELKAYAKRQNHHGQSLCLWDRRTD